MNYRTLGRTGLAVSEIGFGGIPIQRVSVNEAVKIIKKAQLLGVNFIDTGIVYTDSEEKIGEAIKDNQGGWIVASKSPSISYQEMKIDIEKSLENLKTPYIDLYQIHHLKDEKMLRVALSLGGAYQALKEAQKQGKIKFIGVTGHNLETLLLASKTRKFDTVMVNFNFKEQEAAQNLIPFCQKENIGLIVMKPLAGGTFQNAAAAVKFCLATPGVSTVIPGIANQRELEEDIASILLNPKFISEDEKKLKEEVAKIGTPFCRACGYCLTQDGGCPARINITLFLRLEGYFQKHGALDWIMETYKNSPLKPPSCIFCGHCERVCPFNLPIMRSLRDLKVKNKGERRFGEEKKKPIGPPRDYLKEYQEFVKLTEEKLGLDHDVPLAYFNYPKPANEGQKATVRSLWQKAKEKISQEKEGEILRKSALEMGISPKRIETFENLLALADYNNIVDLMRYLPSLIKGR